MVQVRKRSAVNYAEEAGSDSENDVPKSNQKPKSPRRAASPKVARTTPKPASERKRRAPAAADVDEDSDDTSLLGIVKKHGTALTVAAKDWVQRYKDNNAAATAELLTFLIQACGSDEVISEGDLEDLEVDTLKKELDEKAQEEGLEDHFRAKGQKNFRSNYLELWDKIIREAYHANVLFDQSLVDKVINLLIALNTSVVRDFRRVATLTSVQLVTSFIHVSHILAEARSTAERQLAVEQKKKGGKGNSERITAFQRSVSRAHEHINELKDYTDSIFQAVCQHRFRDCAEDIRASVIEGIGHWICSHPSEFLSDQYLKYIAWALSDKDAVVRGCAASALLRLYSQRDNLSPMHDFTERFMMRFKELIYDVDEGVAMKGVQLLTVLVRSEQAPASSVKEVYTLLGDESYGIRHAVAELAVGMLAEQGEKALREVQQPKATGGRGRRKSGGGNELAQFTEAELQLAGLLRLMHLLANEDSAGAEEGGEAGEPVPLSKELVAQVVDALFDRTEVLSDWGLMVEWLKGSKAAEHFGDVGVANLAQTLRLAVIKATGGQLLAGHVEKKARGKERLEAQAQARQEATLVLIKELPTLLKKLSTDPAQATAVLGIIPELKLEIYSLKRQDKGFASVVNIVKDTLFKHDDPQVAQECARALSICARDGTDSIKDSAQLGLRQCSEEAAKRLGAAVDALLATDPMELSSAVTAFQEGGEEDEEEVLYNCRVGLGRVKALLSLDGGLAGSQAVYDALNALVESLASGQQLGEPIAVAALSSMLLLLLWQFRALDPESPDQHKLATLAQRRSLFVTQLESIIGSEEELEAVDEACSVLSDLCLCFSAVKMGGSPLEEACFSPSDATVTRMWQHWEGVICQELEEGAEEGAASKLVESKVRAASKAAQLALFNAIPQRGMLAAQLVSHYVGQQREVTEAVREVCRLLKKVDPGLLPGIYLEALKAAYRRVADQLDMEQDDGGVLDQFVNLGQRIAQSYAGFNASAPAVAHIVGRGAVWAVQGAPGRLPFLQGVAHFVGRLPAAQASAVLRDVQAAAGRDAPTSAAEAGYPWNLYCEFVELLSDRVAKAAAGPKSVLKHGGAAAAAGGAASGKKSAGAGAEGGRAAGGGGRKISFMPQGAAAEPIEEDSDEERENQEPLDEIEEDHREAELFEEEPGPSSRPAQRGGRGRAQQQQQQQAGARRGRQRQQQQQASQQQRASQDTGAGGGARGWRQAKRGPGAAASRREEDMEDQEPEESEHEEEQEEEEEQVHPTEEVLPTEEQLPGRASGGKGGGARRRQPKLHAVFQQDEEGQGGEDEGEEGEAEDGGLDDEDLVDIRGRPGRQAPVVDPEPEARQEEAQEDEEEQSQEVQRARRRRRR